MIRGDKESKGAWKKGRKIRGSEDLSKREDMRITWRQGNEDYKRKVTGKQKEEKRGET